MRGSLLGRSRSPLENRDFVRRVWCRSGANYSKEGWLFQLAAFRRLFKRTVLYHKSAVAVRLGECGSTSSNK